MVRFLLLVLAVLALPQLAVAGPINSTSQGTFATAQNVNGFFTTNFLTNVQDSTTIAHVEINQAGRPGAGYDFYTFTHGGGIVHLDIDDRTSGSYFDTEIGIWNSAGTLIATNDDNGGDAGDVLDLGPFFNSKINNLNLAAGTYVVGVAAFNSFFQNGSPYITGAQIGQGGGYTLNISANAVPVPSSLVLLGTGMLAVGGWRLRRFRKA